MLPTSQGFSFPFSEELAYQHITAFCPSSVSEGFLPMSSKTSPDVRHTMDTRESENVKVLVAQSCLPLRRPPAAPCSMVRSPPSSSVRGTLQARILEWVAMLFSRGSS